MRPRGEPFCDTLEASAASFARKMNLDYTEQRYEIVKETPQAFFTDYPAISGTRQSHTRVPTWELADHLSKRAATARVVNDIFSARYASRF
jgi:hypothetical protein